MPDTPADALRAAARRIRECAAAIAAPEPVNSEPWHTDECGDADHGNCPCIVAHGRIGRGTDHEIPARYIADAETPELARWIALMHPGVGELIADWLESTAEYYAPGVTHPTHVVRALAVARAVLEVGQ
jgi:hypothetical protein